MTDPFAVPPPGAATPEQPTAPLYGEPLRGPVRNGAGTAALVLGCISVFLGALIVPPLLAVIFGIVGIRRARHGEATNRGMAVWGTILGTIGLLIGGALVALIVYVGTSPAFDRYRACADRAVTAEQTDTCTEELAKELF